uniref:Activated RNA polymerase II transcriptional coactivator p15 n=1 Tax=Lygus hesperus TaxID=30085 RepID=A0A0A9WCZ1_LYGHE
MPQKKKAQDDSDSDTSDVSLNSEDGTKKQPAKKAKTEKKPSKTDSKAKSSSSSGNSDESVFQLGGNKQVTVREFRGKLYVDIREFYMDKNSAEMKPGKKGVALSVDMWRKLCDLKDEIDEAIKNS